MRGLLALALLFTPFSTGVDSGLPVISFGMPFLLLALFFGMLNPVTHALYLPRSIAPALLCAAAVVAAMTMFSFTAPYPEKSLARLAPNLIGFLVALRLLCIYRDAPEQLLDRAVKGLALSGAVMALYYLLHLAYQIHAHGAYEVMKDRAVNGLAALPWGASNMISAALLFSHAACHLQRWRHGGTWPGIVLTVILCTVIATISRAGMLVHFVLLIVGCLCTRNYRYMGAGILIGVVLVGAFAIVVPDSFSFLVDARFNAERDLSNGRLDSFNYKIGYIAGNVMTPIGYYGSLFIFDGLTSHNFILTILVEQGLTGLAAVTAFLVSCWAVLFRAKGLTPEDKASRRTLTAGALLAFVNLQVEDANFSQPYIIYFWAYFLIVMAFTMKVNTQARTVTAPVPTGMVHA
jgi:O-antigen ligase